MSRKQRYVPSVPSAHQRGRRKAYAKPAPPEPEEPEEARANGVHRDRLAEHFARRKSEGYAWDRETLMRLPVCLWMIAVTTSPQPNRDVAVISTISLLY
jgi:hypothetical protein